MSHRIPNPTAAEEQRILELAEAGTARADITKQTGFSDRTIRRTLSKLGFTKGRGKKLSAEARQQVVDLHEQGRKPAEISRDTGIAIRTVRRILSEAAPLKAPIGKRIVVAAHQSAAEVAALSKELVVSDAELAWATAASRMLLMPARDLPQTKRLKTIDKALSEGLSKVGKVAIDGRSLAAELRDVGSYAMQMVLAAPWEEYAKRFREGGVEAMMKYGAKQVKRQETPVEAHLIQDLLAIAEMEAQRGVVAPGTRSPPSVESLAKSYEQAHADSASQQALRAALAFRLEEGKIKKLRGLARFNKEKFWEEIEKERAAAREAGHGSAPVRRYAEQRFRNILWEVLRTREAREAAEQALDRAVERREQFGPIPSMRGGPLTRERVAKILFKSGIQPTDALITRIIREKTAARGRGLTPGAPLWGVPIPKAVTRELEKAVEPTMTRREIIMETRRRIADYMRTKGVRPDPELINRMLRQSPELLPPMPKAKTNPETFGTRLVRRVVVAKCVGAGSVRLGPSISPRRTKRRGNDAFRRLMRL